MTAYVLITWILHIEALCGPLLIGGLEAGLDGRQKKTIWLTENDLTVDSGLINWILIFVCTVKSSILPLDIAVNKNQRRWFKHLFKVSSQICKLQYRKDD